MSEVLSTLRGRVTALVIALLFLPWLLIFLSGTVDTLIRKRLHTESGQVLTNVLAAEPLDIEQQALFSGTRIRVFDATGELIEQSDYDHVDRLGMLASRLLLGTSDGPSLFALDGEIRNGAQEPWFQAALKGRFSECEETFQGELLVCRSAESTGGKVYEVAETSRMSIRVFHGFQSQLLKLTVTILPFALLFGFLLGRFFVRPAEELVTDIRSRLGQANPAPLGDDRPGEFGEIATAFDALQQELSERRRSYGDAMADLAHELKNPVAALRLAGERLSADGDLSEARRQRLARTVEAASSRLEGALNAFLELARAEAVPVSALEAVNVMEVAEGVAQQLRSQEEGATVAVGGQAAWALADGDHLRRVLHNLIENGLSFCSDEGGVKVEISATEDRVRCAISDDGPGIPDEIKAQLFERFYTSRQGDGGTGLGLSIVQALLRAMNGEIHVEASADGGACFVFTLPKVRQNPHP